MYLLQLVNEYHSKYNKMLNKTVDWTKAKLLMKGIIETLLIAADKRGLFHVVVKHEVQEGGEYKTLTTIHFQNLLCVCKTISFLTIIWRLC